ncbi:MAG: DUF4275 family protein [Oscillospiraceae bacterium]|nr:DUF4275 family protein [Oscillospiraceae bacterium]
MLSNDEITEKYLQAFASDIPKDILRCRVTKSGNFLWHIFTWGQVPHITGDEARKALNAITYNGKCIIFYNGYSVEDKTQIVNVSLCDKLSSHQVSELWKKQKFDNKDIYLVDDEFTWTYVVTHENALGPYFCYRT